MQINFAKLFNLFRFVLDIFLKFKGKVFLVYSVINIECYNLNLNCMKPFSYYFYYTFLQNFKKKICKKKIFISRN